MLDLVSSVAALQAAAQQGLTTVTHLQVWGSGWRLPPSLRYELPQMLPNLTHLDLAPDAESSSSCTAVASTGTGHAASLWHPGTPAPPLSGIRNQTDRFSSFSSGTGGSGSSAASAMESLLPLPNHQAGPRLGLAAAQALIAAPPPHLRHLSAVLGLTDSDTMEAWAAVLAGLPPGLTSLRLLGPLCHCPELAAAVAGWADGLPALHCLGLSVAECQHCHPGAAVHMYEDPDAWTSACWRGVLPALTQLQSLQLSADRITEALWADAVACTGLTRLRLRQADWTAECDAAGLGALTRLRDLALTLSDSEELADLSRLTQLTRLELDLRGLMDYGAAVDSPTDGAAAGGGDGQPARGLLPLVTRGLTRLRHLCLSCRTARLVPAEFASLAAQCPALRSLELLAPLCGTDACAQTAAAAAHSACALPPQLSVVRLENTADTGAPAAAPLVRLACVPAGLTHLRLHGVRLELVGGDAPGAGCAIKDAGSGAEVARVSEGVSCSVRADAWCAVNIVDVCLISCSLAFPLGRLCGPALRSLTLSRCDTDSCQQLHSSKLDGTNDSGSCARGRRNATDWTDALGSCVGLRRLRLWGCRGATRAVNDTVLMQLVSQHPLLEELAVDAAAATPAGLAAALPQARHLRALKIVVAGQECAAALGPALMGSAALKSMEVVLPVGRLGFVTDCARQHLVRSLSGVKVLLRPLLTGE